MTAEEGGVGAGGFVLTGCWVQRSGAEYVLVLTG